MKEIIEKELLKVNPAFSREEIEAGLAFFQFKSFDAKALLLKAGEQSKYLFIAEKSIIRCSYFDEEGEEQTLWMKPEQTFLTDYKSFVHQEKSMFNLQVYETTEVALISREDLLDLYKRFNNWALFGIFLTEHLHITLIDVFVNLLANDATQNYRYIEYMFPDFIRVAPLKDIASMLQVSQVTLSRIRGGTQTKK